MIALPVLASATLLALPTPQEPDSPRPLPQARALEGTALVIEGTRIPMQDFADWLVRFRGEAKAPEFVELFLLEREAERLGVAVPAEVVRAETRARLDERIRSALHGDRGRWVEELASENRTVEGVQLELDIQIRGELSAAAILSQERVITEEMLRRLWTHRFGRGGHTIEARVIELPISTPAPPPGATTSELQALREAARVEVLEEAHSIRARLTAGAGFAEMARRFSRHPSGPKGGVLTGGFLAGDFSADVLDELEKVRAGRISPPIHGMGSWWLFAVDDVRQTPFESVREDLQRELLERPPAVEEMRNLRRRLLSECQWEVLPAMWADPVPGEPRSPREAVLVIDGTPVRRAEYTRWLVHYHGEVIAPRFVEDFALRREAAKRDVSLSREEIARRIEEDVADMRERSGATTDASWRQWLATTDRTPESLRRDMWITEPALYLAEDMLRAEREVTEAELRAEWEERYGEDGMRLDARVIRLQIAPSRPPRSARDEWKRLREVFLEKKEVALEVLERLESGEDFSALAKRYSDHEETRLRGGEFEDGLVLSDWPAEVIASLSKLQIGQVSDILETETSIVIFQLLESRHTPFDEVRAELLRDLRERRPNQPELAAYRNVLTRDVDYRVGSGMSSS